MKKIAVKKPEVPATIAKLTRNMTKHNWFINIQTTPHKDPEKVWIIVG